MSIFPWFPTFPAFSNFYSRTTEVMAMKDEAAESDSNATLCDTCSKALEKPLVCARCKTATYCSKDCQVHTPHKDGEDLK